MANWVQHQMGSGLLGGKVVPDEVCKINGSAHRYRPQVLDVNTVLLVCECGDTLWKERPKNA